MLSVDVARGVAIFGMILVNATAYVHYAMPAPVPPFLLHANWDGFLAADFVFPAFLYIVGISIALSLAGAAGSDTRGTTVRHIGWRALKLVVLGFFLSNINLWYNEIVWSEARYFGVLQRIGIVYFITALIFLYVSPRAMAVIAGAILILYTGLLYVPLPTGQAADLSVAGLNIVSWVDHVILGSHAYYDRDLGYDPEGILSTLPGVAQCLMGVLTGLWLKQQDRTVAVAGRLAIAAAILLAAGIVLGFVHPIIKDLWTMTFVFVSTGIAMVILAAAWLVNDVLRRYGPVSHFFRVFGVNAIATYTFHFVTSFLVVSATGVGLKNLAGHILFDSLASLVPVAVYLAMNWVFAVWLWKRRIFVKI
ncbi:membrane protein [Aquisalinus flavus]|uniref:Membrane protein n=2 Tax=Aquisalinus flavus TaxID=1526572 RepID=A0A8J2V2B9_9PROT|nr:membrane protein [Aquisalinus flavus]